MAAHAIDVECNLGDCVLQALRANTENHLLILTKNGKGLRFSCDQLRDQGRVTRGVRGIRLKGEDEVVNILTVEDDKLLLIAGRNGLGIRTRFSAFLPNAGKASDDVEEVVPRKRGGQGVTAMNTEAVCSALSVAEDSEILMITSRGQAVRCPVLNIRETNRGSKGVKLVNLEKNDMLLGISEVMELDEEELIDNDTTGDLESISSTSSPIEDFNS